MYDVKKLLKKKKFLVSASAVVLMAVFVFVTVWKSHPPRTDTGMGGRADIIQVPSLHVDNMKPVGRDEANRRVTRNLAKAEEARENGAGYVAPPTIANAVPNHEADKNGIRRQTKIELPSVEGAEDAPSNPVSVNASPEMASETQLMEQQLDEQVNDVVTATLGGNEYMAVVSYNKRVPRRAVNKEGQNQTTKSISGSSNNSALGPDGKPTVDLSQYDVVLAAKPGDVFYSTFKIGFNSDDPQGLPIFATIHDARQDGTYGPLDGAVLMGAVNYTQRQAAVVFTQLILPDGRQADTKAEAVKLGSLRSGVATKVNYHLLERYGSLTAASLLEGLGYAGEMFAENSRSFVANNSGVYSTGNRGVDWSEAGMMAAMPLGQNLKSALGQNFNRQPTKSAKANDEIGVVFLQAVQIPEGRKNNNTVPFFQDGR